MRYHLICRARYNYGIDSEPQIQGDVRIEADNIIEAFIKWVQSEGSWLHIEDETDIANLRNTFVNGWETYETDHSVVNWRFESSELEYDDDHEDLLLTGDAMGGHWLWEVTIRPYKDQTDMQDSYIVRDPSALSYESLVEFARYCQGYLFLDTDKDGREIWTTDRQINGSDFITQVYCALDKYGLAPEKLDTTELK